MAITRVLAIITLSVLVSGTVHAETGPALPRTSPQPLRDAIARQHGPLRQASSSRPRGASVVRHNSIATKVTAGFALGFVGFLAGGLTTYYVRVAARSPGDGRTALLAGGAVGAGAGAALGVWLASR